MPFEPGWEYTAAAIHAALGGGLGDALPHVDGRVVAVRVRPDLNPGAPDVILVGGGREARRWAVQLSTQRESVPVFLKAGPNRWRYTGAFVPERLSEDADEIAAHAAPGHVYGVSGVLFLRPAAPP